jgi:hypothetical protein
MILYILIALAVASFVIAFFSARTWHWAYVLVVEALFLATLGFFILAAETVRINAVLRSAVNRAQKDLDMVEAQNDALLNGTNNPAVIDQLSGIQDPAPVKMPEGAESIPSIEQLDHELLIATRLRGKVWRNVRPAAPANPQTGEVTVAVQSPLQVTDTNKQPVVYVFEDGPAQAPGPDGKPRGAQYLGEFSVTAADAQQAKLQPVLEMDEAERRRLAASRGPWIMYETMPLDRHEILAGKTDEDLQKILPKQSIQEYLRDGKPATADDDPYRVVGLDENGNRLPPAEIDKAVKKVYSRRLRDYAAEFDELSRRRVVLLTEIDALNKDIARLTAAEAAAKELHAFRQDEKQKLTVDLAGINKEREAIDAHVAQLKKQLARAHELTADLMRRNEQLAGELAARQLRRRPPGSESSPPSKPATPLALGQ